MRCVWIWIIPASSNSLSIESEFVMMNFKYFHVKMSKAIFWTCLYCPNMDQSSPPYFKISPILCGVHIILAVPMVLFRPGSEILGQKFPSRKFASFPVNSLTIHLLLLGYHNSTTILIRLLSLPPFDSILFFESSQIFSTLFWFIYSFFYELIQKVIH